MAPDVATQREQGNAPPRRDNSAYKGRPIRTKNYLHPPSRHRMKRSHVPDDRERQRRVYVYEQRRHFVAVVENEAVPPRDDCARQRAVREAVACDEERRVAREQRDGNEVEDGAVVAEVEKEVVP